MEHLLDTMNRLLPPRVFAFWRDLLPALQRVTNISSKFQRAGSSQDEESLRDYICEFRFALVFLSLGFEVHAEPLGDKGPDLLIRRDKREAFVECKRFRRIHDGPSAISPDEAEPLLEEYGDFERDTRKALSRITEKFRQVEGNDGLICIWNDDEAMEELEVGAAVEQLRRDEAAGTLRLPERLHAVVYGSEYILINDRKQIHCYTFRRQETPILQWLQELVAIDVNCALSRTINTSESQ